MSRTCFKGIIALSYVRDDDAHDLGRISDLRTRLEGEVRIQTGGAFPIFQDRNDTNWGATVKRLRKVPPRRMRDCGVRSDT